MAVPTLQCESRFVVAIIGKAWTRRTRSWEIYWSRAIVASGFQENTLREW